MRRCAMFCIVFLFVLLTTGYSFAAQDWISFQPGSVEGYPEVTLLSSNANELTLHISFPGMNAGEITGQGEVYQALSVPGGGRTYNVGWAELPTWSRFVAVPRGATAQVEVVQSQSQVLSGYNVYPAQEQPVDKAGAPQPEFVEDAEFYSKDEFYPERLAFAGELKIIRSCGVSSLALFPVQYNPARGELRVFSEMTVRVTFVGGDGSFIEPRYRSPYFENLFQNLLLNYSAMGPPPATGGKNEAGCDFLIVTHPNFQAWAESLALWKNLSGIPTRVVTTTQIGSDTGSIRSYVQGAYDLWLPPPSFLLLVGDAEFVPLFYRTTHSYDGYRTGTDLYYAALDGADFFPDIYTGRMSVDTYGEIEEVMGKVINYQRNPITFPSSFYHNALAAGYYQDRYSPYGYADRFFLQTSETVRDFLLSQGYTVERCYTKTTGSTPQYYYYGDPIPPGLVWTGDATQINNAINDGVFLVTHRDHGSESGWGDPDYHVSDVNSLANGNRLPVVLSINCETGHFDNETDSPGHSTPSSSVYFCEAFQRKAYGGAVGIFGHTRVSWSGLNDELCKGFYDAIWTDFDPSYPSGGSTHPILDPMYRMGPMLNFAKFWMYDKYYLTGGSGYPWGSQLSTTKTTFEMGTWFGDPTMQIWTGYPGMLEVTHTDTILVGSSPVSVNIQAMEAPVEGALVCLMNDEVYETGHTDASGQVVFSCSTTVEGSLHITATKHDFRPYQGSILVAQGAFIRGDANGDSVVDGADAVFLINYLFHGDSAPYPYAAGDLTCDGMIDGSDIVYLINYLYRDGPAPDCP